MQLILASQSPQRLAIFKTLGIPFEVVPSEIDEKAIQDGDSFKRAEYVAVAKAQAIQKKYPEAIIVAADTYVVLDGQTLEKPSTKAEAKAMLKQQSGQWLTEVTGWCYLDPNQELQSGFCEVGVLFRDLSSHEIDRYVAEQPVTTWSAAFCPAYVEGAALIAEIEGSFTAFTHGFPVEEIVPLLRRSGIDV